MFRLSPYRPKNEKIHKIVKKCFGGGPRTYSKSGEQIVSGCPGGRVQKILKKYRKKCPGLTGTM